MKGRFSLLPLIFGLLVILCGTLFFFFANPSKDQRLEYYTSSMKMKLSFPNEYKVNEKLNNIIINAGNEQVVISRIATDYDSLSNYLENFDNTRTTSIGEELQAVVASYDSLSRVEKFNGGPISEQKVYYIYKNNWVYSFSTSSIELYDDLDQIAKSFEYVP